MWATEWLCAILPLQLCLQGCLWLSHEMPRQGAISDFLHHIDNLVHYQFRIHSFLCTAGCWFLHKEISLGSWVTVSMAGLSCTAPCPAVAHQPQDVPHVPPGSWSLLWSPAVLLSLLLSCCWVCWVGEYVRMLFSPQHTCWARTHLGTSRLIQDKPVENWSQPGLGTGEPGMGSTWAPEQEGELNWAVQGTVNVAELILPSLER